MDSQTLGAVAGVVVVAVVVVFAALVLFMFKKPPKKEDDPQETPVADAARPRAAPAERGRTGTARMRPGRGARQPQQRQVPVHTENGSEGQSGSEDGDEDEEEERTPRTRKEEKKAEKEAQRLARLEAEEARKNKTTKYDSRRAAKEKEREEKERAQEEEMQRAAAERQAQEDEEASKWMNLITVETGGTGETEAQEESQGLLAAFIGYIRERKMVLVEDLAAEFKLRSTEVVDRIQGLESMGRLTGIMDERGKFIYVSPEEMQAVADFIRKRGRISIAELAAKSNQFIDLEMREATVTTAVPAMDFDAVLNSAEVDVAA